MKKTFLSLTVLFLLGTVAVFAQKTETVLSPNGQLKIEVKFGSTLTYSVYDGANALLKDCRIGMDIQGLNEIGTSPQLKKVTPKQVSEEVVSPFYRVPKFQSSYNEKAFTLKNGFTITFRAFNEGVAYRFSSNLKKPAQLIVKNEIAEFNFPEDYMAWIPYVTNHDEPYRTSFENMYDNVKISEAKELAFAPLTVDCKTAKVTIMESDVESYPGLFLAAKGTKFTADFAEYPKTFTYVDGRKQKIVKERESFIAKTRPTRTFPWRVLAITHNDTEMPVNNLVFALASPNRIGDVSWIKPGKLAWDWWNSFSLTGVDFKVGVNNDTYKYYIDFAADHKIEYIALDEGWYYGRKNNKDDKEVVDILNTVKSLDLPALVEYAKKKNVGIVLWLGFNVLDEQLETACKKYSEMGIKGFKVDFLDRNDQEAVETVYRVSQTCAKYNLFVDYHGMYAPTGYNRTFPNILNIEGVYGLEQAKWGSIEENMPLYCTTFPFIRMMPGYVDYTPGAMRNANKHLFRGMYSFPMSQGTRCHQLAMYVVFDSPLTMLCDAPTAYEKEEECTKFIASIPNQYQQTIIPCGEIGKYIVSARVVSRSTMYVGGLNNWDERDIELDFSFLKNNDASERVFYEATIFQDGVNANHVASDYKVTKVNVNPKTKLKIHMASGGGFAMYLRKQVL